MSRQQWGSAVVEDWFPMRILLWEGHPAFIRLTEICDMEDVDLAIGKFGRLLAVAHRQSKRGFLKRATTETIDRLVGYPGFADALISIGWAKVNEDGFQISGWEEFNASTVKERILNAERQRRHRGKKLSRISNASGNAPVTDLSRDADGGVTEISRGQRYQQQQQQQESKDTKYSGALFEADVSQDQVEQSVNVNAGDAAVIILERSERDLDSESPETPSPSSVDLITNARKPKYDPAQEAIDGIIDTPEFRTCWSEWCQYRKERGFKLTETTVKRQFATFKKWGPDKAILALATAIEKGWQGFHDPDENKPGVPSPGRGDRLAPQPGELKHLENHRVSAEAQRAAAGEAPADGVPF